MSGRAKLPRFAAYYSGETPKINGLVFNDEVNLCDAGEKVRRSGMQCVFCLNNLH